MIVAFNATATNITVAGINIFTPTQPILLRALTLNGGDAGQDPLTGAGGATTISIGTTSSNNLFVNASTIAAFNSGLICWGGGSGPRVNDSINGVADAGVVLAPAGSIPGFATAARLLTANCNAGTVSGTLRFRFEFRPFAGGTF